MKRACLLAIALVVLVAACSKAPQPATAPAGGTTAPRREPPRSSRPDERTLSHTVREGETLRRLADLYCGDPARAAAIAADNGIDETTQRVAGSVLLLQFADREYDAARRRAVALEPYNRGVAALARSDLDEAERQFRLALQTVPDFLDARYNLALVYLKRGQAEAAAELLAELVRARPDDPDFGFAFGNALFQQTRYDEAAAAFARVLAADPSHRRAAFGHARALQEAGRRAEAVEAWNRYLALDPTSSWAAEARRHLRELQGG